MAKWFAKKFYKSKEWLNCRASYIAKRVAIDGGMCEECGELPGYIVHHTIQLTPENINDPEVALNHDFLKYDCKRCHDYEDDHFIPKDDYGYRFDETGQPVPIAPPKM